MNTPVYVWDRCVRLFHWSLVAAFATAWLTAEDAESVHVVAGYTVLALVALRLVWGVIGSRHARFADFVRGPAAVRRYLASLLQGRPEHHRGHNPAGGWMVVALLVGLLLTGASGLMVHGYEGHGPLANRLAPVPSAIRTLPAAVRKARHRAEERWEEIHEVAANGVLVLVVIHVLGVVVASALHRDNLIRAMFDGHKRS